MYKCESPICVGYETENRHQIHCHHIIPREHGGNNKKSNLIFLCPNCHSCVFIEESTQGIHSIKTKNSIILNGWLQSSGGRVLEYIDSNGKLCYQN